MGLLAKLFGQKDEDEAADDRRLEAMVARVLELNPRLRLAQHHEARLKSAIQAALSHLDELVASFPVAHPATAEAWSTDPYIRAYFVSPDDIGHAIGRSTTLREFFDRSPGQDSAYAVLGMKMTERRTLGVARDGDATRSDVPQTTLSFGDHRIRICGADEVSLREEIVRLMIEQLAIEGLARITADNTRRDDLELERALLATRLRLLERQGTGMRSMLGSDDGAGPGDLARVRAQMKENDEELQRIGPRSEALNRQLDSMCEAFAEAEKLLHVTGEQRRINRMNIVSPEDAAEDCHTLDLRTARVPGDPPEERTIALLRVARGDVPQKRNLLDDAERLL